MYGSELKATNGLMESNWLVVPMRTMPPSLAAERGAAEAAGAVTATLARPRAMRQSSLRAVMRSPAIRCAPEADVPPERGGYALVARWIQGPSSDGGVWWKSAEGAAPASGGAQAPRLRERAEVENGFRRRRAREVHPCSHAKRLGF